MYRIVWIALLGAASSMAQPAFEVASVRPHEGDLPRTGGTFTISGPRLSIRGFALGGLILRAYKIKSSQLGGATLDRTFYDVEAKAGEDKTPTEDEFMLMLQSLLADRFKLQVHREVRDTPVYALVVGKAGPKFNESVPGTSTAPQTTVDGPNIEWSMPVTTMAQLADRIRQNAGLDRPVLDKTGLTGTYSLRLKYMPRERQNGPDSELVGIRIFTAVQEQLGLKLESQVVPVEMLIVDHVEKPTAN
jgi:uncharacterized protein (TIGR03435 family)